MKKSTVLLVSLILLMTMVFMTMVGCGGNDEATADEGREAAAAAQQEQAPAEEPKVVVTEREAPEAFAVSLAAVMFASLQSAFGEAPEGAVLSEDKLTLRMDKMPLTEFEDTVYSSVSGTASNNGEEMVLTLDEEALRS